MTIDWWTLGIQAVNVLILIWLLGRFFWRPIAAMIEKRRATAEQILTEAKTKRSKANDAVAEIERTRAGFAKERDTILGAAHAAAEEAKAVHLEEAAKDAARIEAAAKAAIEKENVEAEKVWAERASQLAVKIAKRLAARLDGKAVRAAFLEWLLKEIQDLPEAVRQAAVVEGVTLEAISATPIEPADQERFQALIGEAFGAMPAMTFKADPDLIAGFELRGPHLFVRNSWRADLAKILEDITHDSRP